MTISFSASSWVVGYLGLRAGDFLPDRGRSQTGWYNPRFLVHVGIVESSWPSVDRIVHFLKEALAFYPVAF
jgi:hypothetical protein